MDEFNRCVTCKHEGLEETKETDSRTVAGYTFQTELEVQICPACGERYYHLGTIGRFEKQIASWLAGNGIDSGEAFQFMRKTLKLRAVDLGALLEVAPETISRWEKGHRPADRKAVYILASMVLDQSEGHDNTLQRLRSLQEGPPAITHIDFTSYSSTA